MADVSDIPLIDLDSTIQEVVTSIPLVPLPRVNSPFEVDVSSNDNNPFDLVTQAVGYSDDPFESVFKKIQEYSGSRKTDRTETSLTSEDLDKVKDKNEKRKSISNLLNTAHISYKSMDENKRIAEEGGKTNEESGSNKTNCKESGNHEMQINYRSVQTLDLLSHIKSGGSSENRRGAICDMASHQNKSETFNQNSPDIMQTASKVTNANPKLCNKCSPQTVEPKYHSTPQHCSVNYKRKIQEECAPVSNKKVSLGFENLSPSSLVKTRIEKCIAEAEKNFKKQVSEREKQTCRKSLDSLMSSYSNSNSQRNTNFRCDQNLHGKYLLNVPGNIDPKYDVNYSFKNVQNPTMIFSRGHFVNPPKVQVPVPLNVDKTEEEHIQQHEARFMSTLFKATAEYRGQLLANESVISFVDSDSEEETFQEGGERQDRKRMKISGSRIVNSEDEKSRESILSETERVKINVPKGLHKSCENEPTYQSKDMEFNTADEKSFKPVKKNALVRRSSFSPSRSTSTIKSQNYVETRKNNLQLPKTPQNELSRCKSDSTIAALKKKEQMAKSSKCNPRESSRFANLAQSDAGAKSPQIKQAQAKSLGRVTKSPKPLSKMHRNKK